MKPALALVLVTVLVVSALTCCRLRRPRWPPGPPSGVVTPASTPSAVSWTASEYCASDAHPGFLGFVVPYCPVGAGYAAPPVTMYNVTGATTGVPVWTSAANNSSGEVVILANSVLTQPTAQPVYDFPTMWAYLPSRGWLNLTAASSLGTTPGTLGYDLTVSGGCMAWDPAEHYFLAVAGQDKASGNGWTFTYAPGSSPLPGWHVDQPEQRGHRLGDDQLRDGLGSADPGDAPLRARARRNGRGLLVLVGQRWLDGQLSDVELRRPSLCLQRHRRLRPGLAEGRLVRGRHGGLHEPSEPGALLHLRVDGLRQLEQPDVEPDGDSARARVGDVLDHGLRSRS